MGDQFKVSGGIKALLGIFVVGLIAVRVGSAFKAGPTPNSRRPTTSAAEVMETYRAPGLSIKLLGNKVLSRTDGAASGNILIQHKTGTQGITWDHRREGMTEQDVEAGSNRMFANSFKSSGKPGETFADQPITQTTVAGHPARACSWDGIENGKDVRVLLVSWYCDVNKRFMLALAIDTDPAVVAGFSSRSLATCQCHETTLDLTATAEPYLADLPEGWTEMEESSYTSPSGMSQVMLGSGADFTTMLGKLDEPAQQRAVTGAFRMLGVQSTSGVTIRELAIRGGQGTIVTMEGTRDGDPVSAAIISWTDSADGGQYQAVIIGDTPEVLAATTAVVAEHVAIRRTP